MDEEGSCRNSASRAVSSLDKLKYTPKLKRCGGGSGGEGLNIDCEDGSGSGDGDGSCTDDGGGYNDLDYGGDNFGVVNNNSRLLLQPTLSLKVVTLNIFSNKFIY